MKCARFSLLALWCALALLASATGLQAAQPVANVVLSLSATLAGSAPSLTSVQVRAGTLNPTRARTGQDMAAVAPRYRAEILDASGAVLHSTEFGFLYAIQVPLPEPGQPDGGVPASEALSQPQATLVLPYFREAARVRVVAPDGRSPGQEQSVPAPDQSVLKAAQALDTSHGDPNHLYVLIMASGYTDFTSFNRQAAAIQGILGQHPKITVNSYANTANLGCAPGCSGIDRLLCCDSTAVVNAAAASRLAYDEIIVVHNTATYAGGGYRDYGAYQTNSYSSYCMVYDGSYTPLMSLHEFGHSFGNLCDEYTYGSEGYSYYDCVNCRASCSDWASVSSGCNRGCDAKSAYYRPEPSIMLDYSVANYNAPSWTYSLTPRITYFAPGGSSSGGYSSSAVSVVAALGWLGVGALALVLAGLGLWGIRRRG